MITILSFFRKRIIKVYLIILITILSSLILLTSFKTTFEKQQNDLFSNNSELVILNSPDILKNLKSNKRIENVKQVLAFEEDESYDVFLRGNYKTYDDNGNLIDSVTDAPETKFKWLLLEKEGLKDYILVYSSDEFGLELSKNELIIGINDFFYEDLNQSDIDSILNRNIGFIFNKEKLEFIIKDIKSTESSFLIISPKLYDELIKSSVNYSYTAEIKFIKEQQLVKKDIENLINEDSIFSIVTNYKNETSNIISDLYDILDMLKILSIFAILIISIISFIIIKGLISDVKKSFMLFKRLGFNNFQIRKILIINLFLLYIISIVCSLILTIIISLFINKYLTINLTPFSFNFIIKISVLIFIFILFLVTLTNFNNLKEN